VVTDDPQIAARVRRLKDFGRAQGGHDHHDSIGYNFNSPTCKPLSESSR
jgi:perosamine synthetase